MTASQHIPILDLKPQIDTLWPELQCVFERVMKSGQFILGPECRAFEAEASAYLGVKHAIGLNSGTDALFISLRALGIGAGDEVITTPFTFFATAEAISHVGAIPVFVDIEAHTFNIDPHLLEAAITPRTRAIIPVHLFGRPCDMGQIRAIAVRHGLKIIEDCAQSFGASCLGIKTGTIGTLGCYSFFPTKNLGAFGDGGMLVTQDENIAEDARMLRMHGSRRKYYNEVAGYNSRLDELQAAILRIKLPHINNWNEGRRRVAHEYAEHLGSISGLILPEIVDGHIFHQYTIRILNGKRDSVQAGLAAFGIGTMVYYPVPCHRLKLYQKSHHMTHCPIAEHFSDEVLSLPIWNELESSKIEEIANCLKALLN